jgi:hypothetical protein
MSSCIFNYIYFQQHDFLYADVLYVKYYLLHTSAFRSSTDNVLVHSLLARKLLPCTGQYRRLSFPLRFKLPTVVRLGLRRG